MPGQELGVDLIIRARDQVAQGVEQARRTLMSRLGNLGQEAGRGLSTFTSDVGDATIGRVGRQMYRGVVDGLVDGADDGLASINESFRKWRTDDKQFKESGKSLGLAVAEGFANKITSIPIGGEVVKFIGEAADFLGEKLQSSKLGAELSKSMLYGYGGYDGSLKRNRESDEFQAKQLRLGKLAAAAREAGAAVDEFVQQKQSAGAADDRWIREEKEGLELVTKAYLARSAAADNRSAGMAEAFSMFQGDQKAVVDAVAKRRAAAEAAEFAEIEARRAQERIKLNEDLATSEERLAQFRSQRDGSDEDQLRHNASMREAVQLVDARYEAQKRLAEGNMAFEAIASASRAVELVQLQQLVAQDERRAKEKGALEDLGRGSASLDEWIVRQESRNDEEQRWVDLVNEGNRLVDEKYAALERASNGEASELAQINAAREAELDQVQQLVRTQREQEEVQRRLGVLTSAESRLAAGVEGGAVLALRFRAEAGDRAQRQAAAAASQAAQQSVVVDPRLLQVNTDSLAQQRLGAQLLEKILDRLPEYVTP